MSLHRSVCGAIMHRGAASNQGRLADGFHRYHAHHHAGAETITADVRQGTRRDAVLFSVGANADHSLRRTNADKRKAVMALLEDAEWGKWSASRIAKQCAVSPDFAAKMKRKHESSLSFDDSEDEPRTYTTKHGTTAVMNTANIGRKPDLVGGRSLPPIPGDPRADPAAVLGAHRALRTLTFASA